eukprot:6931904-Pyramimonas_sp.AAC.1
MIWGSTPQEQGGEAGRRVEREALPRPPSDVGVVDAVRVVAALAGPVGEVLGQGGAEGHAVCQCLRPSARGGGLPVPCCVGGPEGRAQTESAEGKRAWRRLGQQ